MKRIIKDIILLIILVGGIYFVLQYYNANNFNNFQKGEINLYTSQFTRDDNIKYSKENSYKITSEEYNDAMFYETIKVEKNTPYKVSCMVKTNNVQSENNISGSGAQISIEGTTERSIAVTGTTDWKKIELVFNSKNREEVNVGFRLGGYLDYCVGEAWFTDFNVEQGHVEEGSTSWSFACFIFEEVDATVDGQKLNYTINTEDISDMEDTVRRFQMACGTLSGNQMSAKCDIYKIDSPITKLSYDQDYGYYVAPEDVEAQISDVINSNNYDHIFVIFKLDDDSVKDWIGLRSNGLLWGWIF